VHGLGPAEQMHCVQQADQAKIMITVKMGNKNMADLLKLVT
jgi:hypothetical protein